MVLDYTGLVSKGITETYFHITKSRVILFYCILGGNVSNNHQGSPRRDLSLSYICSKTGRLKSNQYQNLAWMTTLRQFYQPPALTNHLIFNFINFLWCLFQRKNLIFTKLRKLYVFVYFTSTYTFGVKYFRTAGSEETQQ